MKAPIYLDYAASTPLDPRVLNKMLPFLSGQQNYGNPSSSHFYGRHAAQAIEHARMQVAQSVNAKPDDIIWTAGATESNNLAIKGVAYANRHKGKHIITSQIEHSSVLDVCAQLEKEGFELTYLPVANNGLVDFTTLNNALRADTILVSIMHVNNEIGVVQDLVKIAKLIQLSQACFHVDAVQSVGKIALDLAAYPVDLMSFSAHKVYGPKGVGALYINQQSQVSLQPILNGGGQECGLRPGTLPTHQIVGMGEAFAIAHDEFEKDNTHIKYLSEHLWQGISQLNDVYLNGDINARVPHILNVAFAGVEAKTLLPALKNLAVSTGSACQEGQAARSHVLQSIGLTDALINNSIRFSLGRFTTKEEIDFAIEKIYAAVTFLRKI